MNSVLFLISASFAKMTTEGVTDCVDQIAGCADMIKADEQRPDSKACTTDMYDEETWIWDVCPKTCGKCPRACKNKAVDCYEIMNINDDHPNSEACKNGTYNGISGSQKNQPLSVVCPVNCMTCNEHEDLTTTTTSTSTATTEEKPTTGGEDSECKDLEPKACQLGNMTSDQCRNGIYYAYGEKYDQWKFKDLCAKTCSKYFTIGACKYDNSIPKEENGETCFDALKEGCPSGSEANSESWMCNNGVFSEWDHKWNGKHFSELCRLSCGFC